MNGRLHGRLRSWLPGGLFSGFSQSPSIPGVQSELLAAAIFQPVASASVFEERPSRSSEEEISTAPSGTVRDEPI